MAYFDIYLYKKLIRTIINFLFSFFKKHKKILIFLFLFISYLFISNKCFAFTVEYNNNTYNLPNLPFDPSTTDFIFGVRNDNNRTVYFEVACPVSEVDNKGFWSNDLNNLFFRYRIKNSSQDGEWYWWHTTSLNDTSSWGTRFTTSHQSLQLNSLGSVLLTTLDIYSSYDSNIVWKYANKSDFPQIFPDLQTRPSFVTTIQEASDINNTFIKINPDEYENSLYLKLYNDTADTLLFDVKLSNYEDYIEREDLDNPFSDLIYVIPYSVLPSFNLVANNDYEWRLSYDNNGVPSNVSLFFTANGNINSGDETGDDITNSDINNSINETNDKLDSIEGTITDSTVDVDVEDELPTVEVQDPTQQGIDNIFNSIYNAFCTGQAQNIILPIPYTQKNITVSPYYVRDMLINNGVGWLYIFIQAFWAYLFGRFIIKDISNKINKIKSGDIDNIQNTNIKEDML